MGAVLFMFRDGQEPRSFPLKRDAVILGRREDCDLRIPLGPVSRRHCRIIREDGGLTVEDMGSSNGTYVNGRRVQQAKLEPGDTLQIGPLRFVVQIDGDPSESQMQPATAAAGAGDSAAGRSRTAKAATTEDSGDFDPMAILGADDDD